MSRTWTIRSTSPDHTDAVARAIGRQAAPDDWVGLAGPLGAGKTQFVRGLAAGAGADPRAVSSPTFVLMQEYAGRLRVVHVDVYRLDVSELETIGWAPENFAGSLVVVEWADRIAEEMPEETLWVDLEHDAPETRSIRLTIPAVWDDRVASAVDPAAMASGRHSTNGGDR